MSIVIKDKFLKIPFKNTVFLSIKISFNIGVSFTYSDQLNVGANFVYFNLLFQPTVTRSVGC